MKNVLVLQITRHLSNWGGGGKVGKKKVRKRKGSKKRVAKRVLGSQWNVE